MHSRTIVLAVGLLAAPLSLLVAPQAASTGASNMLLIAASPEDTVNGHVLTPAPISGLPTPGVPAEDRVAQPGHTLDAGPINSTPFSDSPTGTLSEGGDQASQRDRTLAPADSDSGAVPNLGK